MIATVVSLVRITLYKWVFALCELLKILCGRRPPPKKPHEHRPTQSGCVPINHPAFVRPNPFLYSQRHLIAQNIGVTWNNPDIALFKSGQQVSSADLEPATAYEVRARIWNNSLDAPVINMPVHLSYLDFGIGTEPIPISSVNIDVGVKGSPNQPNFAKFLWTTPVTPGHYCLQVLLDPIDDLDYSNNLGQENTNVVEAQSPAVFNFRLRNDLKKSSQYHFEVDAYQIPPLPKCNDVKRNTADDIERHRRDRYPVPAGFTVQIEPSTPTLDPEASITIKVTVDPPAGFIGRQNLNVNAFHQNGFAGGITLTCVKQE